jgi:tetratricopeptide (TPR) repeat protein
MKEQDYITIEAFLEGTLPTEEASAVEIRAAQEPEFASELANRRRLYEHLRANAGEASLRATLNQLGDRHFTQSGQQAVVKPIKRNNRRWLVGLVAAAVIALAMIFGGRLFAPPGNTYEQFAQHQALSLTERGTETGASAAESAFNEGRYAEAIDRLQAYLEVQADDERARLALGVSLLEQHQDSLAVTVFEKIAAGESTLAPYGNWYLALAAVKRGNTEAALSFLSLIPESDTYLTNRVRKLKTTL